MGYSLTIWWLERRRSYKLISLGRMWGPSVFTPYIKYRIRQFWMVPVIELMGQYPRGSDRRSGGLCVIMQSLISLTVLHF